MPTILPLLGLQLLFSIRTLYNGSSNSLDRSVIARNFQASYWPIILRTDSAASTGVRTSVVFTSRLSKGVALLVSVASIVTPLGLYESISPSTSVKQYEFRYATDPSVFGEATPSRPVEGFSRVCGDFVPVACPNSGNKITVTRNSTTISADTDAISVKIPANITDFFQSGPSELGQTVSSIFDLQWRKYTYNTEDILFIEPQTSCVDTNLTFEFTIPLNTTSSTEVKDLFLVDNGGFTNLNHTFPTYDITDAQKDPQLAYRAYRGAWMNNAYTALFYNVTNPGPSISGMKSFSYLNSQMGKKIPMIQRNYSGTSTLTYKALQIGGYGSYLTDVPTLGFNNSLFNSSTSFDINAPENPWQITLGNFSDARK